MRAVGGQVGRSENVQTHRTNQRFPGEVQGEVAAEKPTPQVDQMHNSGDYGPSEKRRHFATLVGIAFVIMNISSSAPAEDQLYSSPVKAKTSPRPVVGVEHFCHVSYACRRAPVVRNADFPFVRHHAVGSVQQPARIAALGIFSGEE